MGLGSQTLHASKWSVLTEIASKAISPIVFLVLARLLSPKDYGVAATAAMVISFSQIIWEAGLAKSLIQKEAEGFDVRKAATSIFWCNISLSSLVYVGILAVAPLIAYFFNDPRVTMVIRVQGFQIVIASLSSVQTALFQRKLNYKSLFWVRFLTIGLPGFASIPLALHGFGYWALVAGSMLGATAQASALWIMSDWRPRFQFDFAVVRDQAKFGLLVLFEGLVGWSYVWLDNFMVARILSIQMLGLYRTGSQITAIAFSVILEPLLSVLFSTLSRIQFETEKFQKVFLFSVRAISTFAFSVAILLFLFAYEIETFVFGTKWVGVYVVIQAMAFQQAITWMVGLNSVSYRAKGRPDINAKLMIVAILFYSPIYYFTAQHSFEVFTVARAVVPIPVVVMHFFINQKYGGIRAKEHFRAVSFKLVLFVGVILCAMMLNHYVSSVAKVVASIIIAISSICIILYSERIFLRDEILPKILGKLLKKG